MARLSLTAPLNLHETLFCGQAFRWQVLQSDSAEIYTAVVQNAFVALQMQSSQLLIASSAPMIAQQPLTLFVQHYLGLFDNLQEVFSPSFQRRYPHLVAGALPYFGLRLLRQAPFETLISFMCAQGIGIALIRRQVMRLAQTFGTPISFSLPLAFMRKAHSTSPSFLVIKDYTFPTPNALADAPLRQLRQCTNNNSRRAENIRRVARAVADGSLNLNALAAPHATLEDARETLLQYHGIGDKIADCICLFGLGHHDAFPIDTHVRQYLAEWFGLKIPTASLCSRTYRILANAAREILGTKYAGLAGQWLFHHWRRDIKKMRDY
ncbi:MAG: DNA-3-methyladenine glycosylase family protein [Candidatus Thermochlorobacter sp.]